VIVRKPILPLEGVTGKAGEGGELKKNFDRKNPINMSTSDLFNEK